MKAIKNALVMDAKARACKPVNIYYEGNTIVKLSPATEPVELPADDILDAEGCYTTCGLIDGHTHLGVMADGQGFEGMDVNEKTDPVTPNMRVIDAVYPQDRNFREALQGGVTVAAVGPGSANTIGGTFACIHTYGSVIDDMIIKYPMAMKAAFGENIKRCYGKEKGRTPLTRMGIAALIRETLQKTVEYKNDPTHKFNAKLEAMVPVVEGKLPLKCHAHLGIDMMTAIRIAREFQLKITLDHCTDVLSVQDAVLAFGCPLFMGPTLTHRTKIETRASSFKTVAAMSEKTDVCIITDAPVIPLHHLPLCVGLAIDAGMDEWKGLEAVTINPAKAIGIADRYGSLEPGKEADIVVWKKKPFVHVTSPKIVVAGGKTVNLAE